MLRTRADFATAAVRVRIAGDVVATLGRAVALHDG